MAVWSCHAWNIDSQIRAIVEIEMTGKKNYLEQYDLRRDMGVIKRNWECELGKKLPTTASLDNGIKMNTVVVSSWAVIFM